MVSIDRLLEIITEQRALGRLQQRLSDIREEKQLTQRQLPVTGTADKTAEIVRNAVEEGFLTTEELAEFVDEIEDSGGQHIFLFDVVEGHEDLFSESRLSSLFSAVSKANSESFYARLPDERWYWYRRENSLVIKQVRTADFWKSKTVEKTEDRRVVVWERKKRRATNSLWYEPNPGVQVRIARVSDNMNDDLATALLNEFMNRFPGTIEVKTDLLPVRIWHGFRPMILAKEETYMTVDEAQDPSVTRRISNRRERGKDVRDHDSYDLDRALYARKSLNIYWRLPWEPTKKVHTMLSRVSIGTLDLGKVFVNAKVTPKELAHVLSRIRYFAGKAP